MAIADQYAKAAWETEGLLATWTPDRRLAVGDVVRRVPGGTVVVEKTLTTLLGDEKLPNVVAVPAARSTLLQSGVTVESETTAGLSVGMARIALSGSRSFLFRGGRATLRSFDSIARLRARLLSLAALQLWERDWELVIAVREYAACTVVIAESEQTRAEIRVEGTKKITSLAGITAGGQISVTAGRASTYAMGQCTPFYEALRVRRKLTGSAAVSVTLGGDDGAPPDAVERRDALEVVRVSLTDSGLIG